MSAHVRAQLALILGTILICVILYPLFLWGAGAILFPDRATGSLIRDEEGKVRGSRLIAQAFSSKEYFWPRPSAASYDASASGASNLGGNSPKLRDRVAQQLGTIIRYRKGDLAGPDIEKWALATPERLKSWADTYEVAVTNWAKTDYDWKKETYGLQGEFVKEWVKTHPEIVADWKKANPKRTDEPRPEELAGRFFKSYAEDPKTKGTWPGVVEEKQGDETVKVIRPVTSHDEIRANFFDMWLQDHPDADLEPVHADMVTASGSGLDPHITLRNALSIYQLNRVAEARGKPGEDIEKLVRAHAFSPLASEPLVNVLELNLALDRKFPMKR
jgi:K+-transporting ATPase ATPase C chain